MYRGRNHALFCILTLKAFDLLDQAVALYGTRTHLYRCLLLGDVVFFHLGLLYVSDRETWDARWVAGAWVHNG